MVVLLFFTVGLVDFTFHFLLLSFFMVESHGPGSDAAAVARLLRRSPSLCAVRSANVQVVSIQYSCFFSCSRGAQRLHVHVSPLVLGVGRHKVAETKKSISSASTTYPFVLIDIYSRVYVSFSRLTVSI